MLLLLGACVLASDFHQYVYHSEKSDCTGAYPISISHQNIEARCLEIHRCVDEDSGDEYTFSVFRMRIPEAIRSMSPAIGEFAGVRRGWKGDDDYCGDVFSTSIVDVDTSLATWCVMQAHIDASVNVRNGENECVAFEYDDDYIPNVFPAMKCSETGPSDNIMCEATGAIVDLWAPAETTAPTRAPTQTAETAPPTFFPTRLAPPLAPAQQADSAGSSSGGGGESGTANAGVYFIAPLVVVALVALGVYLKKRRPEDKRQLTGDGASGFRLMAEGVSFTNPQFQPAAMVEIQSEYDGGQEQYVYSGAQGDGAMYDEEPSGLYDPIDLGAPEEPHDAPAVYDLAQDGGSPAAAEYDLAAEETHLPEDEGGYLVPAAAVSTSEPEDFGV